jgi:hypothetical protein
MNLEMKRQIEGITFLVAFAASIPAANWMIGHVGTVCVPSGPCLLPVAPGISAPSGVLMVGFALVLRDLVQRRIGKLWTLVAIVAGTILSALLAPPALVIASSTAFLLSELADFVVYSPLQRRGLLTAVIASGAAGILVDSVLFLWLAFGDLSFLAGQVIGKAWAILLSLPVVWLLRERDLRIGLRMA